MSLLFLCFLPTAWGSWSTERKQKGPSQQAFFLWRHISNNCINISYHRLYITLYIKIEAIFISTGYILCHLLPNSKCKNVNISTAVKDRCSVFCYETLYFFPHFSELKFDVAEEAQGLSFFFFSKRRHCPRLCEGWFEQKNPRTNTKTNRHYYLPSL